MNVDAIALALRPRPMLEASDLGVRLVQRHARDVWGVWWPVLAAVVALAFVPAVFGSAWPALVIFVAKPWLDRTILYVLARAAFGQRTRFADVLADWRTVWTRQLWRSLTIDRLTFWRAFTLPVVLLEGQRGAARGARIHQLARQQRGAASLAFFALYHVEAVLTLGLVSLLFWFAPPDSAQDLLQWLANDEGNGPLFGALAYAVAVLVVEPFYVGTGFAMYLNRRVELEAWDIEQEFRRAFGASATPGAGGAA